jgi:hypothetical protein
LPALKHPPDVRRGRGRGFSRRRRLAVEARVGRDDVIDPVGSFRGDTRDVKSRRGAMKATGVAALPKTEDWLADIFDVMDG